MTPQRREAIAARLKALRYDYEYVSRAGGGYDMVKREDGEWIRYEELEPSLSALTAMTAERDEARAILEAINVALAGQGGVTDFELSFPVVMRVVDALAALNRSNALLTMTEERAEAAEAALATVTQEWDWAQDQCAEHQRGENDALNALARSEALGQAVKAWQEAWPAFQALFDGEDAPKLADYNAGLARLTAAESALLQIEVPQKEMTKPHVEPFYSCPRCVFDDGQWMPCKKHQPRPAGESS